MLGSAVCVQCLLVRLLVREGGDGGNGACYRHHDRRNIKFGICLRKR